MELPALLPEKLFYAASAESDHALFELLIKALEDFLLFFEYAADDETWTEAHAEFIKEALFFMTLRFFENKFPLEMAKRAASKIREHHSSLQRLLPKNLVILLDGAEYEANSLLWQASCEFLRSYIRQECFEWERNTLQFEGVKKEVLEQIQEYIQKGEVPDLWRLEQKALIVLLQQAADWEIEGLIDRCQEVLKRYLNSKNCIDFLLESYHQRWQLLKSFCTEFINGQGKNVRFKETTPEHLGLEFIEFSESAMEIFDSVCNSVTMLIFKGSLTERPEFSEVISRCPKIVSLDISESSVFSERLLDLPETIEELNLAKCPWLTKDNFRELIKTCPNLENVGLASNLQLTYTFWPELKELKFLEKLDISHSTQISDSDFKMILQACKGIAYLFVRKCTALSEPAFFEIGKNLAALTEIDVSETNITDSGLIDIAMRCKRLSSLNIARCFFLSEKGILGAVLNASNLKNLDFTKCSVDAGIFSKIKQVRPFVKITSFRS